MRVVALLAALALLTGACRGSTKADDSADPTLPPESTVPASTTTTQPADPFAVPAKIDAAYVDRVLVELNRVYGDVVRQLRATRLLRRADLEPLTAIFSDPLLDQQFQSFSEIPRRDPALYKNPIGDRKITVQELLIARPDCIFAKVLFDVSAIAANPPAPRSAYITLKPKAPGVDPNEINRAPWSMSRETEEKEHECNA